MVSGQRFCLGFLGRGCVIAGAGAAGRRWSEERRWGGGAAIHSLLHRGVCWVFHGHLVVPMYFGGAVCGGGMVSEQVQRSLFWCDGFKSYPSPPPRSLLQSCVSASLVAPPPPLLEESSSQLRRQDGVG